MSAIYRILNVANDHFYIGSSVNTRRRRWEHWDALKKGVHHCAAIQRAWNEFGEDAFEFEIVEEVTDDTQLLLIEETYLMKHAGSPNCYNTAMSVHQSPAALPRVRARISEGLLRKYEDPTYTPRVGKLHTEETKAKIEGKDDPAKEIEAEAKMMAAENARAKIGLEAEKLDTESQHKEADRIIDSHHRSEDRRSREDQVLANILREMNQNKGEPNV